MDPDLEAGYPAGVPCAITPTFADGTMATASRRQPVGAIRPAR